MIVIHVFKDVPNMRNAVNRADTVRFAFLRDHTWVAGRGVLRFTHTHTHIIGVSQNVAIYVIIF